jgi:hypothetical protein
MQLSADFTLLFINRLVGYFQGMIPAGTELTIK